MIKSKKLYCFTGASGVGKTTLLNEISNWEGFEISELSARPFLPINGKDYIENSSHEVQYMINYGTMVTMTDKLLNSDSPNLFFSRCGIDRLAYSDALQVGEQLAGITMIDIQRNLKNVTVFYIPIEFPLTSNDTLRGKNELIRNKVDNEIQYILDSLKVNYIEVKGTIDERLKIIKNNL